MRKDTYNIGDRVRIFTLNSSEGRMAGDIGHEGTICKIVPYSSGSIHYYLEPYCVGSCWPADCLELIKEKEENYEIY